MKFMPSFSKRSLLILLTVAILGILYGSYYLSYIPSKEKRLTQEKYRVLERIADNITKEVNHGTDAKNSKDTPYPSADSLLHDATRNQIGNDYSTGSFDAFLMLGNDSIFYQPFKNNIKRESILPDSLLRSFHGLLTTFQFEIRISENDYESFTTHFKVQSDSTSFDCFLVGLVNKEDFHNKTREINRWVLIQFLILLLILLMSMPWIKLVSMNEFERLYRSNIIWLAIAFIFGIGMVMMIYISGYTYLESEKHVDETLSSLSDSIRTRFINELDSNLQLLNAFDSWTWSLPGGRGDTLSFNKSINKDFSGKINSSKHHDSLQALTNAIDSILQKDSSLFLAFNEVLWTDENGEVRTIFTNGTLPEKLKTITIADRDYFKAIKEENYWYLDSLSFALQSIKSWLNNSYEVGIAKPSYMIWESSQPGKKDTASVISVATQLYSVMDPVLLPGFSFAIVDQDGKLWFHSEKERNLQENFFEETRNNAFLKSLLEGRMKLPLDISYNDYGCRAYVSPISDLPLYLITYHENQYRTTRIGQTLIFTFYLLLIYFLVITLQIGILLLIKNKACKLKKKPFAFLFLTPQKANAKKVQRINVVLLLIIVAIAIFAGWAFYSERSPYLYSIAPIFMVSICSIYIIAFLSHWLHDKEDAKTAFHFNVATGIMILVLNLLYLIYIRMHIVPIVVIQILIGLIFFGFYIVQHKDQVEASEKEKASISNKYAFVNKLDSRLNHLSTKIDLYPTFFTLILILISLIPIYFGFKYSDASEQLLWTKHVHVQVADDILNRNDAIDGSNNHNLEQAIKQGFYYTVGSEIKPWENDGKKTTPLTERKYGKILPDPIMKNLEQLHLVGTPSSNPLIVETKSFIQDHAADTLWKWFTVKDSSDIYFKYEVAKGDSILLKSPLHIYPSGNHAGLNFWLAFLLIITIVVVYKILSYSACRIFAQSFRNYFLPGVEKSQHSELTHSRIFLIKMPYSIEEEAGVQNKIDQKEKDQTLSFRQIHDKDFQTKVDKILKKYKVIKLREFGYKLNDHETWKLKLSLLEEICKDDSYKIIIESEVQPQVVSKYYEIMIQKSYKHQWTKDFRKEYQDYRHAKDQWSHFFTDFVKVFVPIGIKKVEIDCDQDDKYKLKEIVNSELKYGSYLRNLSPVLKEYCKTNNGEEKTKDPEEVIIKIQSLAQPYYQAIWSTLSKEEKFLLYDLAVDGFVNAKNEEVVRMLLQKGLLVYNDRLEIMNKSFDNFVATVVNEKSHLDMRREIMKKGRWTTLHLIFVIIILGVGAFVILGQQHLLDSFDAAIGAILAAIGVIVRFTGVWGSIGNQGGES